MSAVLISCGVASPAVEGDSSASGNGERPARISVGR